MASRNEEEEMVDGAEVRENGAGAHGVRVITAAVQFGGILPTGDGEAVVSAMGPRQDAGHAACGLRIIGGNTKGI